MGFFSNLSSKVKHAVVAVGAAVAAIASVGVQTGANDPSHALDVDGVCIGHDQVGTLGLRATDFIGLADQPSVVVVLGRAEHDHAAVEGELGVDDAARFVGYDEVLLEAEHAAQPFDRGKRVPVAQAGYRGRSIRLLPVRLNSDIAPLWRWLHRCLPWK